MWAEDLYEVVCVSGLEFGGGAEHAEGEEGAGCYRDGDAWVWKGCEIGGWGHTEKWEVGCFCCEGYAWVVGEEE